MTNSLTQIQAFQYKAAWNSPLSWAQRLHTNPSRYVQQLLHQSTHQSIQYRWLLHLLPWTERKRYSYGEIHSLRVACYHRTMEVWWKMVLTWLFLRSWLLGLWNPLQKRWNWMLRWTKIDSSWRIQLPTDYWVRSKRFFMSSGGFGPHYSASIKGFILDVASCKLQSRRWLTSFTTSNKKKYVSWKMHSAQLVVSFIK